MPSLTTNDILAGAVFISQPACPSVVGDELSVDILPKYRGSGYAEGALRRMMEKHGPRRFIANVAPENYASMALFKKLGFKLCQYTFELEDALMICGEVAEPEPTKVRPGELMWVDPPSAVLERSNFYTKEDGTLDIKPKCLPKIEALLVKEAARIAAAEDGTNDPA
jgi:hypothetical protein